jgi:hypothetical protein
VVKVEEDAVPTKQYTVIKVRKFHERWNQLCIQLCIYFPKLGVVKVPWQKDLCRKRYIFAGRSATSYWFSGWIYWNMELPYRKATKRSAISSWGMPSGIEFRYAAWRILNGNSSFRKISLLWMILSSVWRSVRIVSYLLQDPPVVL